MCINYIKYYDEITLLKYRCTFKGSIIIFVLILTKVYGHFNDLIEVSGDKLKASTTKNFFFIIFILIFLDLGRSSYLLCYTF